MPGGNDALTAIGKKQPDRAGLVNVARDRGSKKARLLRFRKSPQAQIIRLPDLGMIGGVAAVTPAQPMRQLARETPKAKPNSSPPPRLSWLTQVTWKKLTVGIAVVDLDRVVVNDPS
uniref:Uncharacterized protein n=1 Tax=Coccidioides posadasii RMSCC 3488 TaxID=454284 RepID=A0A0J6IIW7_COCPO|nr:hypothetical protein CPAG_08123 [Coccidioides posadasii RMSCC 3488]